jgi:hypothetical protein
MVLMLFEPIPDPSTNNQRSGVNVDATSLLLSLKNTLNSLSQIAYILSKSISK